MNNVEKVFVREHEKFCEFISRSSWDGEEIKKFYPKNELIGHLLLSNEMFYLWTDEGAKRTLLYAREAYPETTEEDLHDVYEANKDFFWGIYG